MFRVASAALAAAVMLLPGAVVGQLGEIPELDSLEDEFEQLAYGGPAHRGHRHHGYRHLRRHHQPHHHRHHKKAFLFARGPATTETVAPPGDLLAGRHSAVAKKLGHMETQLRDLAGRQQAAHIARGDLEENVQKAVLHMNDALGIKRELSRTEYLLHSEEKKLKKLEDDRLRLDRTHGHLVSSLHHIMEPKIQFAETRLKQKQRALHNLEQKAAEWKDKETQLHEASLAGLEERKEEQKRLEAATDAMNNARSEQDAAKKGLEKAKHNAAFNIERYRYSKTRAQASMSEEERGKKMEREAEVSVKRLSGILNMEQRRVDESMAVGKDRVQGRIRELEGVKEKTKSKATKLSEDYAAWQQQQRAWASRVAATKQITHEASQDYAERQRAVLDAAQAKVAYDAESDSDWAWDEWPGKGSTDEGVRLGAN